MQEKIPLASLFPEEIASSLSLSPAYRARQVYLWVSKGVTSFDQMKNLDAKTLGLLNEKATLRSSYVSKELCDDDETVKLQIRLSDGCAVETVLLTDKDGRKTACVSSQAGCAMKCAFCKTGTLGLSRNLTDYEIVEEFMFLEQKAGTLSNIVFMGMGEPLQNLDAIRKALAVLTDPKGRALSPRRVTVSTCGLVNGIYDLADKGPLVRLAVSLTTADQSLREKLMPVSKANPISELKKAIAYFAQKTQKRVTLEAALMHGVNTDKDSAKALIDFAQGLDVHVNLIPWNPVSTLPFTTPSKSECLAFQSLLSDAGINTTLRFKRGSSVNAACGQLGEAEPKNTSLFTQKT